MRAFFIAVRAARGERDDIGTEVERIAAERQFASPVMQARILQRLANATYCLGDLTTAERYAQDAALLATDLSLDTLAATCYGMLYSIAAHVDENTQRARTYLRAQAT